jgi:hypothetical protein
MGVALFRVLPYTFLSTRVVVDKDLGPLNT